MFVHQLWRGELGPGTIVGHDGGVASEGVELLLSHHETGEQFREAVEGSVPTGTEELNLKAFDGGWGYFDEHYGADAPSGDAVAAAEVVSPVA